MNGYQMKITIKGSKPPVWRRILIPKDSSFYQLHETIQALFGWMDYHLYVFDIPKLNIQIGGDALDEDIFHKVQRDNEHALFEYLDEGMKFTYTYDFGDDWTHQIVVEKEIEMEALHPVLVKWKGDNFAEDAGNVWGYDDIVTRSQNTANPEHQELKEWLDMQHIPFCDQDVQELLSEIEVDAIAKRLDSKLSQQLDEAIMVLKHALSKKTIVNLSLIVMETPQQTKYIGFNQTNHDITLQIYENETDYLQGVDYVSSTSQGNLYANAICLISTSLPLPVDSWKSSDGLTIIKKMRTGYLPIDLNDEEATTAIIDLKHMTSIIQMWDENEFPTYETNECIYAKKDEHGWSVQKQLIKLEAKRLKIAINQKELQTLETEAARKKGQIKIDVIAIPQNEILNYQTDVVLVIEGITMNSDVVLTRESLKDFYSMNEEVLEEVIAFLYDDGIPDKILVNNENVRFMLSGLCEALKINLGIESFITKTQKEFSYSFEDENDMEILETMANMDNDEFIDFIQTLGEDELVDFQSFLKKYINEEDLEQIFQEIEEDDDDHDEDDNNHKTRSFDA